MSRPLVLLGGGGHCKSVIDAALGSGHKIHGILDLPEKVGSAVMGIPVVGTEDDICAFASFCDFVVTVGQIKSASLRVKLFELVRSCGGELANVVAPTAYVSPFAEVGPGSVVLHGATINAGARLESNVIINCHANIDHEVCVGDHCHISTCASLNGQAHIGPRSFVGSGAVVAQCVDICSDVVIGAGAVVLRSISQPGIYAGVPIRKLNG